MVKRPVSLVESSVGFVSIRVRQLLSRRLVPEGRDRDEMVLDADVCPAGEEPGDRCPVRTELGHLRQKSVVLGFGPEIEIHLPGKAVRPSIVALPPCSLGKVLGHGIPVAIAALGDEILQQRIILLA
jgi:hypothetical protein